MDFTCLCCRTRGDHRVKMGGSVFEPTGKGRLGLGSFDTRNAVLKVAGYAKQNRITLAGVGQLTHQFFGRSSAQPKHAAAIGTRAKINAHPNKAVVTASIAVPGIVMLRVRQHAVDASLKTDDPRALCDPGNEFKELRRIHQKIEKVLQSEVLWRAFPTDLSVIPRDPICSLQA